MKNLFVKTGNVVRVMTGKDKGKTGKVLQTFPKLNRVVVEGVNIMKRHLKSRREGDTGQVIEFPMPIHASNVRLTQAEEEPAKTEVKTTKAKTPRAKKEKPTKTA